MCGIAGSISVRAGKDLLPIVAQICESQIARGPDAKVIQQYRMDSAVATFGHNRLSIVDLSASANQPMHHASGDLVIVLNGEIYNYVELRRELEARGSVFATSSDTEVLLEGYHVWGVSVIDKLLGMFAFAILDRRTKRIILVRDRFGVKPLYYWTSGGEFVFASTVEAIARWAGLKPNLEYVSRGLNLMMYEDESDLSPYIGLPCLRAGHFLTVEASVDSLQISEHAYFDLTAEVAAEQEAIIGLSYDQCRDRVLELLMDSCRIRLRADVPVGVSLSGGLDSSSIASIAARMHPNIQAFSYGHPDSRASEGRLVKILGEHVDIEPVYVWPNTASDVERLFWLTMSAQQAPFLDGSALSQFAVFEAARNNGVKVILGGQGGDEAFMGYRKFFLFYASSILEKKSLDEAAAFLVGFLPFFVQVMRRWVPYWNSRGRYFGGGRGMRTRLRLPDPRHTSLGMARSSNLPVRQALDVTRFSLPSLLRYEDRNSMGNSVESRLPFIDHRLVRFGLALPARWKIAKGFGKWILRDALQAYVPDKIRLNRDKRGFDTEIGSWVKNGLGKTIRDAVFSSKSLVEDCLPKESAIDELFRDDLLVNSPLAFGEAVSLIWIAHARGMQHTRNILSV